jgi:hypothetical protein
MNAFLQEFMDNVGPQASREMSNTLGINKRTAQQIIPQLVPLILGGLKRQKDERGGAPRVDHILNKYGSPDALDNIHDLFQTRARETQPDPRLGGLVGESGIQASEMLSEKFGLDSNTVMKIIPMIAPLVLGFLTRKRDQQGLGSQGIASLLDQDGDGSVLDDVAGFLMQNLSGSSSQRRGNVLGNLLGGLLSRR